MLAFLLVPLVSVSIATAPCPDYPGMNRSCYMVPTETVYMAHWDRFTYLHEMGHAYDYQAMSDIDRASVQPLLQEDHRTGPWRGGVEEEFASLFALCVLGDEVRNRAVCEWLQERPSYSETIRDSV